MRRPRHVLPVVAFLHLFETPFADYYVDAIRRADIDDLALAEVKAPTLVIRGDRDQWVDAGIAERLAKEIPTARLARIADAARLVPEEAPEQLTELLVEFVGAPRATTGHLAGSVPPIP